MAFVLNVPIVIPFLLEHVVTYYNEVYSLKEHEDHEKNIFFIVTGSIWFVFILD